MKKKPFLTCTLLRWGHPLNLLPANPRYWGPHSQKAVCIVRCRHFSFLQLPFVLTNKIYIWCIMYKTVSLKTTEERQGAIQLCMVTALCMGCQVYSANLVHLSLHYIRITNGSGNPLMMGWSRNTRGTAHPLTTLGPQLFLILSDSSTQDNTRLNLAFRHDRVSTICYPITIISLWLLLLLIYTRGLVTEPLQFRYQMLPPSKQLASSGIKLQKSRRDETQGEKMTKGRRTNYGTEIRQPRKMELKQSIFLFDLNTIHQSSCGVSDRWNCPLSNHFIQLCSGSYVSFPPSLNFWQEKPLAALAAGQCLFCIFYASQKLEE